MLREEGCDAVFEPCSLYANENGTSSSGTANDLSFVVGKRQPEKSTYQTYVTVGQHQRRSSVSADACQIEHLEKPLCGITRPHFFRGVATVSAAVGSLA